MNIRNSLLLAGASVMVISSAANAQTAPGGQAIKAASSDSDGDIIVTARRKDELLINVPQTVTAVSSKQLQEYQINNFQDIANLVAGLTLQTQQLGFGATASTRGVTFQVTSQGSPTVEQYFNEVPIEPNHMAQSNYDIGQIEVLRGPQGTLRGRSAPSGAITETTRRADLSEIGGYVSANGTNLHGYNLQGAVGIPIVKDVLSLRVAGVYDRNDAGGVKSANNPMAPYQETWSGRATLRFEPGSDFRAVVMYQRIVHDIHEYGGILFGPGVVGLTDFPGTFTRPATGAGTACSAASGGLTNCGNPAVYAPPNFSGPALTAEQRMNVQDFPGLTHQEGNLVTGQLDWRFGGQKLSYIGSYQHWVVTTSGDGDGANTVVGRLRKISNGSDGYENRVSSELRLSSDERLLNGLLDYTVGGFYLKLSGISYSGNKNTLLMQGAFGSPLGAGTLPGGGTAPGTLSPLTYDNRYVAGYLIATPRRDIEKSAFASVTLHLDDNTEFTAGGRQIWREASKQVDVFGEPGIAAVFNPNGLAACPASLTGTYLTGNGTVTGTAASPVPVVGQTYPGTCDVRVNIGENNGAIPGVGAPTTLFAPVPFGIRKWSPFVYNFSLSHKFTPDLMAYVSYGSSWRAGPGPITAAPVCADTSLCAKFNILDPESSKAFELGIKAALFDKKLNLSTAIYRQTYSGQFVLGGLVPYLGVTCAGATAPSAVCTALSSGGFTYNAPVKTYGIDFDASLRLSKDFNMALLFSWSHGRYDNAPIPCRDANFDGIPDTDPTPSLAAWLANPRAPIGPAICPVNTASSTSPPWNLTLRGEYSHEVMKNGRAFIRGLINYYPTNTNVQVSNINFIPNKYALVNLWAGIRSETGDWEVSLSVKNLFNNRTVLSQGVDQGSLITPQRNLPFANNLPNGCAPVAGTCTAQTTLNSGYRSISLTSRREFALNLRYSFGSR